MADMHGNPGVPQMYGIWGTFVIEWFPGGSMKRFALDVCSLNGLLGDEYEKTDWILQ